MKIALLIFLALATCALAEPPALPLPTSSDPLAVLVKAGKGVLVATLVHASLPDLGPPGYTEYDLCRWQVARVLRGDYPAEAKLSYRVRDWPAEASERPPTVGQKYILVMSADHHMIASIFDYSDERLREVEQLLPAASR